MSRTPPAKQESITCNIYNNNKNICCIYIWEPTNKISPWRFPRFQKASWRILREDITFKLFTWFLPHTFKTAQIRFSANSACQKKLCRAIFMVENIFGCKKLLIGPQTALVGWCLAGRKKVKTGLWSQGWLYLVHIYLPDDHGLQDCLDKQGSIKWSLLSPPWQIKLNITDKFGQKLGISMSGCQPRIFLKSVSDKQRLHVADIDCL